MHFRWLPWQESLGWGTVSTWLRWQWNPMSWFVARLRDLILFGKYPFAWPDLVVPIFALALFWLGLKFFRRFAGHFEDFL